MLNEGQFSEAVIRFDTVIQNMPRLANAHYYRGLALLGKKEAILARKDLIRATELNPRLIGARLILAEFYLKERNLDLAKQQLKVVLEQNPKNHQALVYKGNLALLEKTLVVLKRAFKK